MELNDGVRNQVNSSAPSIAENEAISNIEVVRVKTMQGIDGSSFLSTHQYKFQNTKFRDLPVRRPAVCQIWTLDLRADPRLDLRCSKLSTSSP